MLRKVSILILIISLALPALAAAQRVELTPFVGYRLGGELQNLDVRSEVDLDEGESYGLQLGFSIDPSAWIEIIYSHQESSLEENVDFFGDVKLIDLDVDYYHVGFLYQWNPLSQVRPFVLGSVGITEFSPGMGNLDSESRFSLGFGGGVKFMLGDFFGFRFEGRGFTTIVDTDTEFFCSSNVCYGYTDEEVLWQFEARVGLILAL